MQESKQEISKVVSLEKMAETIPGASRPLIQDILMKIWYFVGDICI